MLLHKVFYKYKSFHDSSGVSMELTRIIAHFDSYKHNYVWVVFSEQRMVDG